MVSLAIGTGWRPTMDSIGLLRQARSTMDYGPLWLHLHWDWLGPLWTLLIHCIGHWDSLGPLWSMDTMGPLELWDRLGPQ